MCADIYTVGLAVDSQQLQQGMTQARTSMQQLGQTEARLQQQTKGVETVSKQLGQTQGLLARTLTATEAAMKRAGQSTTTYARQAGQAAASSKTLTAGVQGLLGPLGSVQGAVGALGAYLGGQFVRSMVAAAGQMQKLDLSFAAVTGSAKEGAEAMAFVRATADTLGVSTVALGESYRTLTAATRTSNLTVSQRQQLITALSAANTLAGGSNETLANALRGVTQAISNGTLAWEELKTQIDEAIPGTFARLAQALGVSTARLKEMATNGELLTNRWIPALTRALAGDIPKAADIAAKSIQSATERMGNAWREFLAALGQTPAVMGIIDRLTKTMRDFYDFQASQGRVPQRQTDPLKQLEDYIARIRPSVDPTDITQQKFLADLEEKRLQMLRERKRLEAVQTQATDIESQIRDQAEAASVLREAQDKNTASNQRYFDSLAKSGLPVVERYKEEVGVLAKQLGEAQGKLQALGQAQTAERATLEQQVGVLRQQITTREALIKKDQEATQEAERKQKEAVAEAERAREADLRQRERLQGELLGLQQGRDALEDFRTARERMTETEREAANATLGTVAALTAEVRVLEQANKVLRDTIDLTKSSNLPDIAGGRGLGAAPYPAFDRFGQLTGGTVVPLPRIRGQPRPDLVGQPVNMVPWQVQAQESRDFAETNVRARQQAIQGLQSDIQRLILSPKDFEKWTIAMSDADAGYKALATSAVDFTFALKEQQKEAANTREAMEELGDSLTGNLFNAIRELTDKGKLSFKDLATSIISDLTRILQQRFLAPKIADWTSKALEWGLQLLGAGAGVAGGGGAGGLSASTIAAGGGSPGLAVGGPVRRGLTLVGEAGPEVIASGGGRSMVFPSSHPLTRSALASSGIRRRQYGGPMPGMGMELSEGQTSEQPAMPGAVPPGSRTVVQNFYITTPDASSFVQSRAAVQRAMAQAVRSSQSA